MQGIKFWNSPKTLPVSTELYFTIRQRHNGRYIYKVERFSYDLGEFELDEVDPEARRDNMPLLAWAPIPEFKE
jgi:hypothetical protein